MAEVRTVPQTTDEKLDYLGRMVERLLVKLLGDVDEENPNGRLPMLEAKSRSHEHRIDALEKWKTKWMAIIAFVLAIVALAEAVAHVAEAVKH